ncbi:MDR family oxidoreductase [Oceanimonas baumannii]|uniref:Acrylyl-CoA reductase (NADPH) n=1 Tax=Oceanimonas baumannii TaxID=129578 RepID=A0A235CI93_9GAMM|nr:MDR family oxidoreductase [Oceanimonas baumannii]OYD24328.1 oxidoreductase [Oceanimonas baumannii]TDW59062.1 acrylyl-CoA reductase (NADPH) [Oceanimonas baumannii]
MFKGILLEESGKQTHASLQRLNEQQLTTGDVLIKVDYSTLNYKDALAITGKGKIVRNWPMVPGIDFAGTVLSSDNSAYRIGDEVLLTGWGVGEQTWGGLAEKASVNADWLIPLPPGMTAKRAMAIGTAGFTAMLGVMALEQAAVTPDQGSVLVTGATGGVGSVAVQLLARAGYEVHASTGRPEHSDWLKSLGAHTIIDRIQLDQEPAALESQHWAGAIDAVGGRTLARILSQTKMYGAVAACGLTGGVALNTTVMPFILRGVQLLGINSVHIPNAKRMEAWQRVHKSLPLTYENDVNVLTLDQAIEAAHDMVAGKPVGRVVIQP